MARIALKEVHRYREQTRKSKSYTESQNFRLGFIRIKDDRIGHLAANTDLFLRRNNEEKRRMYIGIATTKPANKQLLKMFQRTFPILQIPGMRIIDKFTWIFVNKIILGILYEGLPFNSNEYNEFNSTGRNIHFNRHEERKGKKLLKKMGINDDWFICFHSHDLAYVSKKISADVNRYLYRRCNVKKYLKAAEYIASNGGFAVRMGEIVTEQLNVDNPRIIDYSTFYRTDFGDIYLSTKCKFFLGSASGPFMVPTIFHVPVAIANIIGPSSHTPFRNGDLFIPKKLWSNKKRRLLTFHEIFDSEVGEFQRNEEFIKAGVVPIENTSEEVYDLAKEMNERLDGVWKTTSEDEELQRKYWSMIKPYHRCYNSPAKMGALFLRNNRELLK